MLKIIICDVCITEPNGKVIKTPGVILEDTLTIKYTNGRYAKCTLDSIPSNWELINKKEEDLSEYVI